VNDLVILETIGVAFAMFSAIPVPHLVWNERNMRYALCAFPLVGAVCGLTWYGWALLAHWLSFPGILLGAGLCLAPILVSGGIHLDGYGDTCDALASFGTPEKRQEILKDPHCGAFAVIRLCIYFVAWFALCTAFRPTDRGLLCMGGGFVLSRALSGIAIASFPLAKNTGLAYTFATAADRKKVQWILAVLTVAVSGVILWVGRLSGSVMILMALLVFWRYRSVANGQFGGISGDLAGWFLQKAELWMLAGLVTCQMMEAAL